MRVIGCQLDIAWEQQEANYERVRQLLKREDLSGEPLVVLPEMWSTGFSMDVSRTCEADPSSTEAFMAEMAREHRIYLVGGVVRPGSEGKGANEALIYSPTGEALCRYRKIQPFSFGGEDKAYDAGETVVTCSVGALKVAPLICYDLRFPELFRDGVKLGAQLYVVIANWPNARTEHWVTLLKARAIENLAYVVGVNRCGKDPKLSYDGRSVIVDPQGNLIADAGAAEGVITAEIDLEELERWREAFPALRDMRR